MRSVIKAIVRVIFVYAFIQMLMSLLPFIGQAIVPWYPFEQSRVAITSLVASLIPVSVGVTLLYLLWRNTDRVVKWLAGDMEDNTLNVTTSNADLLRLFLGFLGIYLVVEALQNMAGIVADHFVNSYEYYSRLLPVVGKPDEARRWAVQAVTLLLGLWLTLGGKGLARAIVNLWHGGETKTAEDRERAE